MSAAEHLTHPISPVFDERSQALVLGSFPSPKSREQGFFYGHPQNRFWRVLAGLFDEPVPATVGRRRDLLVRRHIAAWDVVASCAVDGASDASIRAVEPNDLRPIFETADIRAVFCAGGTATRLYRRLVEPKLGIPCMQLPSTSPANAAKSLDALLDEWSVLLEYLDAEPPQVLGVPEVQALERRIDAGGTTLAELMERAGIWLAHRAHAARPGSRVLVLVGSGNNGGDGWVAARELAAMGHDVALACSKVPGELAAEPARSVTTVLEPALVTAGVRVLAKPSEDELAQQMERAGLIVDALLGTGFAHGKVRYPLDSWIRMANRRRAQGAFVIAADVPSGLNAQSGAAADPCIEADETVSMIALKPGQLARAGAGPCGRLTLAPLVDITSYI